MAGDDAEAAIHQDRVGPAGFDDASGQFGDLGIGVRARIAGERDQRLDLPVFDVEGWGHGMQKPAMVGGSSGGNNPGGNRGGDW